MLKQNKIKIMLCGAVMVSSLGLTHSLVSAQTNPSKPTASQEKKDLNAKPKRIKRDISDKYFKDVPSPEGPNTPLPECGEKTKVLSDPDKYVYLNIVATKQMQVNRFVPPNKPSEKSGRTNPFEKAILLDKNFKELPKQDSYKVPGTIQQGETVFILAIPKDTEIVKGVKTVKEYYYSLLSRDRVAKETESEFNKSVSYGTTKEMAVMIGQTLGIDFGLNGLSQIPLMASLNYMSQHSKTWGTTVTDETTINKRFSLGKADAGYGYPHYWLGIYQATIDYSTQTTEQLDKLLNAINAPGTALHFKLQDKTTYKLDLLHPVRTKGTGAYINED